MYTRESKRDRGREKDREREMESGRERDKEREREGEKLWKLETTLADFSVASRFISQIDIYLKIQLTGNYKPSLLASKEIYIFLSSGFFPLIYSKFFPFLFYYLVLTRTRTYCISIYKHLHVNDCVCIDFLYSYIIYIYTYIQYAIDFSFHSYGVAIALLLIYYFTIKCYHHKNVYSSACIYAVRYKYINNILYPHIAQDNK